MWFYTWPRRSALLGLLKNHFFWFFYLTKVYSTNMFTAELICFCNIFAWPRRLALLGLLKNHFICDFFTWQTWTAQSMFTAELICFCNFCAWPSWSALLGLLKNHYVFVILHLKKSALFHYSYCRINSILCFFCLTKVIHTARIT